MALSFDDKAGFSKAILALCVATASLVADAYADDGAAVIVASSSPSNAVGRIVEVGQTVRLEPGASVTLLEENGRVSMLVRSSVFRPTAPPPARSGPSLLNSVSALVGSDASVRAQGGVRALSEEECEAETGGEDMAALARALEAQCQREAAAIIDLMIERAGPPQLYVSLVRSRDAGTRVIGVDVQSNFESFLYCRLRRANSSILAITPDPSALPMRVVASNPYRLMFPSLSSEATGAVQCMAIAVGEDGAAPDIGDWPRELDPARLQDGARVATSLLTLAER